ncbi:hypothetical protein [Celeribacter sp. ULVN23_4]
MKWQNSNLGKFGATKALNNLHKLPLKNLAATSLDKLEDYRARRIYDDMTAFVGVRYPETRNVVLARSLLTLGALYAKRAGVDGEEIALFISEEQSKHVV